MTFKQNIYDHCLRVLDEKAALINHRLEELREAISNETKSTAGDKYETARAMIHIEQEQAARQLREVQQQQNELLRLALGQSLHTVGRGSLIRTDKGYFFISIGLGKQLVDATPVYVISPVSPLGKLFISTNVDQSVRLNDAVYHIEAIS